MKRLWRTLELIAWATFFVLAATVLVLRYGLLPQAERLRPEIVARVAATVGRPVTIGRIEAEWLGLRPQINLSDVRIYDAEGREALVLPSVENILSWRSLAHGRLRLHALRIEGPKLAMRRDSAGAFYVAGIKLAVGQSDTSFSDWLLAQEAIEVRNAEIEWRDEKRGAPLLRLAAINVRLTSEGEQHALGLAARPPEALGAKLEVRAQLAGRSVGEAAGWSGQVYAELGYTDLAAWRPWLDYPIALEQGEGAVRAWLAVQDGVVRQATADVALANVRARLGAELPLLEVASVTGRLQGRVLADGYQLTARTLALAPQGGEPLAPLDFQLAWKAASGVVNANALELAPLAHFAEALPLPAGVRKLALDFEPRGQLGDFRFEWQGAIDAPAQYKVQARFFDLGLKPREDLPGFGKLAGNFEATEAGGRVNLQSRGAELDLPRVFPDPRLTFDILNGQLAWQREGAGVKVDISSLTFTNADLSGNVFGSYAYGGEGPGSIDVSAVLNRTDAKALPHYLPLGALMGEKTREWLVQGIVGGEASDVEVRLQGDLRDFPFTDPARGQFLVKAHVQNGLLNYVDGWPRIEAIDAELRFERNRMEIAGKSGRILGATVHEVSVGIADLAAKAPRVLVSGQAQGPTAEFLKFLQSSPLRDSAGRFTAGMSASGDGHLRLKLELPLADLSKTKVAGDYELAGNALTLSSVLPPLEQARAKVAFTDASVALREARGQIFGGTVTISGGTRPRGAIEFVARGEAQPSSLAPLVDHPLLAQLTGATPYLATVTLRGGLPRVVVESTLRGVASALPAPLGKSGPDALPLRVEYAQFDEGARDRIFVSLARVALAEIHRRRQGDAMGVRRAGVSLTPTSQAVRLPDGNGVLVYGSLPALDMDRWRAVAPAGGESLPATLELKLGRVDMYGRRFNNIALRASAEASGWSAVVDADEIAGQVTYKKEGAGQLVARLLRFAVPASIEDAAPGPTAKTAELPSIDIAAEQFELRGKPLGRVEFVAQHSGDDWRIDKASMVNSDGTLTASGRWRGGVAPGSELDFKLAATDVGKFLARAGYPNMVMGGKADLSGTLGWQGELLTIDYPSLSGELKLVAEDGQFLEIDPGIGKLISLMNLQALPRRITLDFRDVFSKGFRFDKIEAVSRVERGVMQLKDFRMTGPAADVAMSGEVDLQHETQDLKLRVVPSLGGTASTAVALVNPVAGVAAVIAQRVLKNPLGQIFAYEFQVSGSWVEPKVEKLASAPQATQPVSP
ncbi:MAG TPA: YhdP family protein [Burkholderiales bacterium]|nr:YhdP family protein [Burkholderiales bacterium]